MTWDVIKIAFMYSPKNYLDFNSTSSEGAIFGLLPSIFREENK